MGFDSLRNANAYIKASLNNNRKGVNKWGKGKKVRAYKCTICDDYHMTSQTKKQSRGFK